MKQKEPEELLTLKPGEELLYCFRHEDDPAPTGMSLYRSIGGFSTYWILKKIANPDPLEDTNDR